ncbi:MAG: sigma-54 interaction domain-containing protein [Bacillota bacterium]
MDLIFSKQNMEVILDYLVEGIQIIDQRGKIIYYNRAAAALDDINKDIALGKHILEIYPSLSPETSTLLSAIRTGNPILNVQQTFINYKGKKITTVNSTIPIRARGKTIGAIEISRNITEMKELSERLVDLQEKLTMGEKRRRTKVSEGAKYTFLDMIGQDETIFHLKSKAMKAAQTSSPILVYGETGTGKELLVQAIHNASDRRNKPFIAQNCGALPASLLEGILFGTVKGSFTGADDRAGLFELADGGTLFLDEINSMPLELQVKLLRVLQDGNVRRVGDIKTRQVDVRIIAASNIDPRTAVEGKQLRGDLYYRLNAVELRMPELKERRSDISLLTSYFIEKFNEAFHKQVTSVDRHVELAFQNYDWPGNVRELEHVIEGAMNFLEGDVITLDDLPYQFKKFGKNYHGRKKRDQLISLKNAMDAFEKEKIEEALHRCHWNISHAADALDIPRQTLQYKLKKYGLERNGAENWAE